MFNRNLIILVLCALLFVQFSAFSQERRRVEIDYSPYLERDEEKYPGATILTRDDMSQVKISHEGATLWCDQAIHYGAEDFIEAYGNVRVIQGDTVNMTSQYVEYSGKTKLAFASGEVVLTEPNSVLTTDTLYFDRVKQQAYYRTYGKVVRDTSGTITSRIGRYYMADSKYQFVKDVELVNEDYTIDSNQLDFYTETGNAYLFGPTTIVSETSTIYCERGFYDTNNDVGYFVKNSRIDYDNRIFEGDSMYFDRNSSFASATNNIKVTDTMNNMVVKGHYAEVFRERDSVFITKRALAITVQERDSLYMHADTLMVTGKPENRITRGYYKVKIFKSDLSGKCDSIHTDHKNGLTQMINFRDNNSRDAFSVRRNPILWNVENQMTGDSIHLISNMETEQLDSLKVFDNAFVISRDSLGDGYNQIKGQKLIGQFKENELYLIDILNNAESIYYLRNDKNELVGIDKSKSGNMKVWITDNAIDEVRKLNQIDGTTFPEPDFPEKERLLSGFDWREDERPRSIEDLFIEDPPLELPVIEGLEEYKPQEEFFDSKLIERTTRANNEAKGLQTLEPDKASRNIPKDKLQKQKVGKLKKTKEN
ncbi:MAG: hypothetical protein HKO90_07660 [Flavobacteriaceae bacterium]|nr:hypothetical protein [Flavobacteriaceae bacterium]